MQGNLTELLKELPPDVARGVARYGVRLAIDLLQTLYADLSGENKSEAQPKRGRGRPKAKSEAALKNGWPTDPEARHQEMLRRREVTRQKRLRAQRVAAAKKRWAGKSKAEKQAWLHAMQHGKKEAA